MYNVDAIPEHLNEPAQAALAWLQQTDGRDYELTGLFADDAETVSDAVELGLVLCDGEICARQQVAVSGQPGSYQFAHVEDAAAAVPDLLDPPPGIRKDWLDQQLAKHEFVLLLYYRGRW